MKGRSAHAVPLTPEISALLESLPRFSGGDFLFSTTGGQRPVSGFSKAKARLDGLIRKELEAQEMPFEDFVIHDIRRTCRTRFSALPVEDIVRELPWRMRDRDCIRSTICMPTSKRKQMRSSFGIRGFWLY